MQTADELVLDFAQRYSRIEIDGAAYRALVKLINSARRDAYEDAAGVVKRLYREEVIKDDYAATAIRQRARDVAGAI